MKRPICIATIFFVLFIILQMQFKQIPLFKNTTIYTKWNKQEVTIKAIVISDAIETDYEISYTIEVNEFQNDSNFKNTYLKLRVPKTKSKNKLQYGDTIECKAIYQEPTIARNQNGFSEKDYLKSKKVLGKIEATQEIKVIKKDSVNLLEKIMHQLRNFIKEKVGEVLPKKEAGLIIGMLIGDKTWLDDKVAEDFRNSNLSHMLAISGAHVSYVILGMTSFLEKTKLAKRKLQVVLISFILFFMYLTEFTPSVTRAGIMAILTLLAKLLYCKADNYTNIAISSLIILILNPYALLDLGFQLSFGATLGIITFYQPIQELLEKLKSKIQSKEEKKQKNKLLSKIVKYIQDTILISIAANFMILPIMMVQFHTISFTFIISNLLASPFMGIIIFMGFMIVLFSFLKPIAIILGFLMQPIVSLFLAIVNFSAQLPFSQITVISPSFFSISSYYLFLKVMLLNNTLSKKSRNFIAIFCIITILITNIRFPSTNLQIHFIDVGQGDSTLMILPNQKTILIDGGGSEMGSFNVGEKTLLPYLLSKKIMTIDYLIFSHFDSDHCQRTIYNFRKIKSEICYYWETRQR